MHDKNVIKINKKRDIRRVIEEGEKKKYDHMVIFFLRGCENGGYGIVIPKGIKSAVKRNRHKRRTKEAVMTRKAEFPKGTKAIFLLRKGSGEEKMSDLRREVEKFCEIDGK